MAHIYVDLAGVSLGQRLANIESAEEGERCYLVRDKGNKSDANAIGVLNSSERAIGIINRRDAIWIAKKIDKGRPVLARLWFKTGEGITKPKHPARLELTTDDHMVPKDWQNFLLYGPLDDWE